MHLRVLILLFVALTAVSVPMSATGRHASKQAASKNWDISATASSLTDWVTSQVLAYNVEISARVVSVQEDGSGCFIDAGEFDGVTVGMVFEIYRTPHGDTPGDVAGTVQIAWMREDYSFAVPMGDLDMSLISTLYFARLVHVPPAVALISDTSEGGGGAELDSLIEAIRELLNLRPAIRPILGVPSEPAWRLTLTPDFDGNTIRSILSEPGGEITGNIVIDPFTGERPPTQTLIDTTYINGTKTPFGQYLAPPGRRSVKIASGNIVPGAADELAILDGSDIWIYDLSRSEPRLVSSLGVSIPTGPVRHREDGGSLELVDLDENSLMEICVSPPGGIRGEIWQFDGNNWVLHQYLSLPARAADASLGGVIVAPYLNTAAAYDPAGIQWMYPATETVPVALSIGRLVTDIASVPGGRMRIPPVVATDTSGTIWFVDHQAEPRALTGRWGNCLCVSETPSGPLVLVTSPSVIGDKLTLLDLNTQQILAEFSTSVGPIIDLAVGDIDRDGKAEILSAVLSEGGVRIYF